MKRTSRFNRPFLAKADLSDPYGESKALFYDLKYAHFRAYALETKTLNRLFGDCCHEKSILEIGCGTGSYLCEFHKLGWLVAGIDRSEHMVHCAEQKLQRCGCTTAELFVMDFLSDNARIQDKKYAASILLYYFLQHAPDYLAAATLLTKLRQSLLPKGSVVFEVVNEEVYAKKRASSRIGEVYELQCEPYTVRCFARSYYENNFKVVVLYFTIETPEGPLVHIDRHRLRVFSYHQLQNLCREAGLQVVDVYGAYDLSPFDIQTSDLAIFHCRVK